MSNPVTFWHKFKHLLIGSTDVVSKDPLGNDHVLSADTVAGMVRFLDRFDDPKVFAKAERIIRTEFSLHRRWFGDKPSEIRFNSERASLTKYPELASVFVFHGDGRLREAAMLSMNAPLSAPLVVYGLVARLNDWSPHVRKVARQTFERCFHQSSVQVLTPAVWELLLKTPHWRRWSESNDLFRREVMKRQDLVEHLATRFKGVQTTGSGRIFGALSQSVHFDPLLPDLAQSAHQPHIRAFALRSLCRNLAVWTTHKTEIVWVDKSLGVAKSVRSFEQRALSIEVNVLELLEISLTDSATRVRCECIDALIANRHDVSFSRLITQTIATLEFEQRPSVRERLTFLERKMNSKDN